MQNRFALLSLLLTLSVGSILRADFRFVHTSDPHFNTGKERAEVNRGMFEEITKLDPPPVFIVDTGDICETGAAIEYERMAEAVKVLGAIAIYHAPGNHDVRWNPLAKEGFVRGTGQKLYQHWSHEGVHFFTLDSTVLLEHHGHISREQLDWLAGELKAIGPDAPAVIGFHHWVGREGRMVDNEQQFLDVIAPYNVVLLLQGHGHSDIQWNINGITAVMQKGLYQGSYTTIDVTKDEMVLRRRAIVAPRELTTDRKDVPVGEVRWRELKRVPLKKMPSPNLSLITALFDDGADMVIASAEGRSHADLRVDFSVDGGTQFHMLERQPEPVKGNIPPLWETREPADRPATTRATSRPDATIWSVSTDALDKLPPGRHVLVLRWADRSGASWSKSTVVKGAGLSPSWSARLAGAVQSRLVINDARVYVTTMAGELACIDVATGKVLWTFRAGDSIFSAACIDNSVAYVGSADHHVYALNLSDGSMKWKTKTGAAVVAGPAVAQGIVCVGSADTKIYGLRVADGSIAWTVQGKNLFQSRTATDGERFFVGGWDNFFRCIDAKTGRELWALELGKKQTMLPNFSAYAPAIAAPVVADGVVYIATNDGKTHAIDIATSKEIWTLDRGKMGYSSPCYNDGVLYTIHSDESKALALNAKTGAVLWETTTGGAVYDSSFAYDEGKLFVATVAGELLCLDAKDGRERWRYRLGTGHAFASPAASSGTVYMSGMSGEVLALPAEK